MVNHKKVVQRKILGQECESVGSFEKPQWAWVLVDAAGAENIRCLVGAEISTEQHRRSNCFWNASKCAAHEIGQQILNRKVRKERRNQRKARIVAAACAGNLQRVE